MKRLQTSILSFVIALVLLIAGGSDATAQNAYYSTAGTSSISPDVAEVKGVVDQFSRMWETQDMDIFDELIANDSDIVIIGTDRAEFIIGFDDYRDTRMRQFDSFNNVEHSVKEQTIHVSDQGNVGWFTTIYDMFLIDSEEKPIKLDGIRVSGVVERRDGRWQIVHLHTSMPVEGQAAEY